MAIVRPTQKYARCARKAANHRAATIAETSTNIVRAGHEWVIVSSDKLFVIRVHSAARCAKVLQQCFHQQHAPQELVPPLQRCLKTRILWEWVFCVSTDTRNVRNIVG